MIIALLVIILLLVVLVWITTIALPQRLQELYTSITIVMNNNHSRMESIMSDLQNSLNQLQDAVQGVADRVNAGLQPLQDALNDAQATVATLQATDAADQETITGLTNQLAAQVQAANDASTAIANDVTQLNAIAAPAVEPTTDTPVAE